MISERDKTKIINYPPEKLKTFRANSYEWIDNLCITISPYECLSNADEYISIVKEAFLEIGWLGDGAIELMWIPPFMYDKYHIADGTMGVIIWHVKQKEDGISYLLYPEAIEKFFGW